MSDLLSKHFYDTLTNTLPGLIYVYNIERHFVEYTSNRSTGLVGYTSKELKKMGSKILATITHPEDLQKIKRHFESFKHQTTNETKSLEFRIRKKNLTIENEPKNWLVIYNRPFERNNKDEVTKVCGLSLEITQLKRTQGNIKRTNILLENITKINPFHTGVINVKTGIIEYSSGTLETSMGLEKINTRKGQTNLFEFLITIMPQEDLVKVLAQFENYLTEGEQKSTSLDLRITDADGNLRWFEWTSMPYNRTNQGEIVTILNFAKEITEEKNHLLQLEALSSELEDLIYVSSNELQQPLNTIQSAVIILNNKLKDLENPIVSKCLSMMKETSDSMKQNIKAILDYSKVNANIEFSLMDLNKVINSVLSNLTAAINSAQAIVDIHHNLPHIKGDSHLIGMLFQNLISNAIKFQEKGNIPNIGIHFEQSSNYNVIHVTDNGIGISEKQQSRIFTLFQRLHDAERFEGSGIGLAHAIKIMKMHSGRLEVKSTLGMGSTFSCYFLREYDT